MIKVSNIKNHFIQKGHDPPMVMSFIAIINPYLG